MNGVAFFLLMTSEMDALEIQFVWGIPKLFGLVQKQRFSTEIAYVQNFLAIHKMKLDFQNINCEFKILGNK